MSRDKEHLVDIITAIKLTAIRAAMRYIVDRRCELSLRPQGSNRQDWGILRLLHSTCVTFAMTDLNETVLRYSALRCIFQYTQGLDAKTLAENIEKQDAILRRITIIGEATKRLSKEFRNQHSAIPWKEMAGMRDVITHDYDEVDMDEVWKVISINLPELLNYIEPLVASD